MSKEHIESIFHDYVFGFIRNDIEREIWLAHQADTDRTAGRKYVGAGNVLAALGLVCYTEFLGSFITGHANAPMDNFAKFLARMGASYEAVMEEVGKGRVYGVYRCGLVHEYAVKGDCVVAMLSGDEQCGIGRDADGRYFFVVERYFNDLMRAAEKLYAQLLEAPVVPK